MLFELREPLSKEFILSHISQEEIMSRYLGVEVQYTRKICSPLRKDTNPTCGFKYARSGKLMFRDFSGHFWGDCFDVVMYQYNLNYFEALSKVAGDFNLTAKTNLGQITPKQIVEKAQAVRSTAEITLTARSLHPVDYEYWKRIGIDPESLLYFDTHLVDKIWVNDYVIYRFTPSDPAYAYRFGEGEYKIYFPYRSKKDKSRPRFISNTRKVQGYNQLPSYGNLLILTKSMKDVIVLKRLGLDSCALQSESEIPTEELIKELRGRFTHIFTLYDFDLAGIKTANVIRKRYGIRPIFLTNGRFNSLNFGGKDPAEMVENIGLEKVQQIVDAARIKYNV